jgi:hypothetical protein
VLRSTIVFPTNPERRHRPCRCEQCPTAANHSRQCNGQLSLESAGTESFIFLVLAARTLAYMFYGQQDPPNIQCRHQADSQVAFEQRSGRFLEVGIGYRH